QPAKIVPHRPLSIPQISFCRPRLRGVEGVVFPQSFVQQMPADRDPQQHQQDHGQQRYATQVSHRQLSFDKVSVVTQSPRATSPRTDWSTKNNRSWGMFTTTGSSVLPRLGAEISIAPLSARLWQHSTAFSSPMT